jgi:hypothetical protein
MSEPRPFRVHIPDAVLDDLHDRLRRARLLSDSPRRMPSGMTADYLGELVDAWIVFDWRAREEWLNTHPQHVADIDGARVHFVHRRAAEADAPALLLMHGWPHTFALQLDFVDLLHDFHVVVPSFPGFAFSTPYARQEMTETALAGTVHALMTDVLGYDRYVTYGGGRLHQRQRPPRSEPPAARARNRRDARALPDPGRARRDRRPGGDGVLRTHRP